MAKRQIIRDMTVSEVSSVDRPAQKGARAVLMKRDSSGDDLGKRSNMTTVTEGHQHILRDECGNGDLNSGETDYVEGHTHAWVRDSNGNITIGMARGHTHELGIIGKKENAMTIKTRAELEAAITKAQSAGESLTLSTALDIHKAASELNAEDLIPADSVLAKMADMSAFKPKGKKKGEEDDVAALKAEMARMKKRDALSTDLRKHYDSLTTDEARDAFLAKDSNAQAADFEKAAGNDPVVYTTLDGLDIRKSAGEPVIAALKSADTARRDATLEKSRRIDLELEKRATEDLGAVGGTMIGKKALLKAVDGIEDEDLRKAALEVVTSAVSVAKKGDIFSNRGRSTAASIEKGDAEGKLEKMAQDKAKADGVSFEKAYDAVLATADGQALYAEMVTA